VTNACKFTPAGGTIAIEAEITLTDSVVAHSSSSNSNIGSPKYSANQAVSLSPLEESVAALPCGSLRVKVSDTGIGIKEHNKDKLFRQFEQFDKNKLQAGGGSGLGLWISHFIVDCHGGKLQFESLGPEKGSVFFFDLPLYRQQQSVACPAPTLELSNWPTEKDDSHPRPHTMSKLRAPSAPIRFPVTAARVSEAAVDTGSAANDCKALKHMTYLLVDDSKGNRRMLRRMLESDSSILVSSIQEAEDGVGAVALVGEAGSAPDKPPIDCIFMDSVMKQMHGPETVRHLRGKLGFTGKILGLTGNAMEDDVKHFQQAGLDLLLIKPLKKAHLVEALLAHGLMSTQPVTPEAPNDGRAAASAGDDINGGAEGGEADSSIKNDKNSDVDCNADNDTVILAPQQRDPTVIHHDTAYITTQAVWNCPFD